MDRSRRRDRRETAAEAIARSVSRRRSPATAAAIPALGRGRDIDRPATAAAAIPAVGRGRDIHRPADAATAIPAVGRGRDIDRPAAEAAAIPAVGRGRDIHRPADAAAAIPAVGRGRDIDRPAAEWLNANGRGRKLLALTGEAVRPAGLEQPLLQPPELSYQFDDLERTTREKGERLFDANRQVLYEQTCDDIDTWMSDLEKQMVTGGTGEDLASVNILMQKQQMIETQMAIKAQQVSEMGAQAEYLERMTPEKVEDIQQKKEAVERRFDELKAPLVRRQRDLEKKKEAYQFRRDVEDEKLWISDKMPLATFSDNGNSLFNVNVLKKKNQSLRTVIDNHEQRIHLVCNNGQKLIDEDHADSEEFSNLIEELLDTWQTLKDAMDNRRAKLLAFIRTQQYFFDASEAESWMSEQELYMMVEDRGKDEISAQNLMKKQQTLELAVEDYAETIRSLGETSTQLITEGHPDSDQIAVRQAQVDKLYAWLRDLAQERRAKLEEALQLFMLSREVDDLLQWINDREVVAGSHELGQDYDHVTLLWECFKEFARH
ncbi:spectrin beta chain-like [Daphnia pulicaria]|uniref:spectrin beta chain-like n=1 Tax=Daphnia pulicaria TaxID=35523 RepID=UPI001EEA2517|nr:spectrin beta chain-like [Daphnia pulicaria]